MKENAMWIAELWRYPVKSMAGELLERAALRQDGIAGDRVVHVRGLQGKIVTARSHPALLGHRATLGADGEPRVDGRPWRSEGVARDVAAAAGPGSRLVRFEGPERFDVLPLLVATDGAIREFGHDRRRLRPNIVIGGVPGLEERSWEGCCLRLGDAVVGVQDLRARCIMTTYDPDTLEQRVEVLRKIHRLFEGTLALDCYVVRGGAIAVGDAVELIPSGAPASMLPESGA